MSILRTVCLLFFTTAAIAAPRDFRLVMHRSACFGGCPVYTLTIDASGSVTFDGIRNTAVYGPHHRTMTPGDLAQLQQAVSAVDFFNLGNYTPRGTCPDVYTDNPGVTITVRMDGHEKVVEHYYGCRGFAGERELRDFEDVIDRLAGVKNWKTKSASIGLPHRQQMSVLPVHFHDHGIAQARMRSMVAEHDPAVCVPSLAAGGPGDVHGLIVGVAKGIALPKDGDGADARLVAQQAIVAARRVLGTAEGKEEHGAEGNPRGVEPEEAVSHARYHTQP